VYQEHPIWTALERYNYFGNFPCGTTSTVDFGVSETGLALHVPNPNPVSKQAASITYELPEASDIQLSIYDITGQLRNQMALGRQLSGEHQYALNVGAYANGIYIMVLTTADGSVSQKLVVSK